MTARERVRKSGSVGGDKVRNWGKETRVFIEEEKCPSRIRGVPKGKERETIREGR